MDHREDRRLQCQSLFGDFRPDLSRCRDPERVLRILALAREGFYSREIAERLGTTPKTVQKIFRRYGFPCLHNFAPPLRENRPGWKGGVKMVKGYLYARTPGHPNASKHGSYVAVHRLVFEAKIGRFLHPHEVVHHLDGNPLNNSQENLGLFSSNAAHLRETLADRCPSWSEDGRRRISEAAKAQWEKWRRDGKPYRVGRRPSSTQKG